MVMVAYRRADSAQISGFVWGSVRPLKALLYIHHTNRVNSRNDLVVMMTARTGYYYYYYLVILSRSTNLALRRCHVRLTYYTSPYLVLSAAIVTCPRRSPSKRWIFLLHSFPFSSMLFCVFLDRLLLPSGTHWSAVMQSEVWSVHP